ncbi:MAG: glycosyltransferase family 4 protein [candidate division WOR-3 bacterium]
MRICLVSAAYRPYLSGVSEHVHNLALSLQAAGHRVHILTTNYRVPNQAARPESGSDNGPAYRPEPVPVTRIGQAVILPAFGGHFALSAGATLAHQVREFLQRHEFDVVHCHGIFPPELAYWAAVYARAPVVATFHSLTFRSFQFVRQAFRLLFPALVSHLRARIAVSRTCAEWVTSWFPGHCAVIPNGVDTVRFSPSAGSEPRLGNRPSILYVSRIDRRKGLAVLLRAMPAVLRHEPDVRLFVVGSGPDEPRCRKLGRRLGIEHAVEYCGFVQPDELPSWYSGCTVFCAPALGPESMGIILVEAMACGRPVVASRICGYDEVITHDKTGLLFPVGNHDALAPMLVSLLGSAEFRQRLGQTAHRAAQEYSWPLIAGRIEQVYQQVVR